jgi:phosphate transport system permease protein
MMKKSCDDIILGIFSWACALILILSICLIIGFLVVKGYNALNVQLVFSDTNPVDALLLKQQVFDGLFPAIAGTVLLVCLSMIFAAPLGLCTGIFMAEYASAGVRQFFSLIFDILAGLPSIVVGLFGFSVTVFMHHYLSAKIFPCLLIASLSLCFLVLPYIIRTTQIALETVPLPVRLTGPCLGAGKLENIMLVLIPSSMPGILSGIILAIGRCAEDTAVIMLTGAVASAGIPDSVFSGFEALPFYIYNIAAEYSDPGQLAKGYGAALILLIICACLFFVSHVIRAKFADQTGYKG